MGEAVWAVGLMSGTSMDGVDAAAVLTDGETIREFGPSRFTPYDERYRALMREADAAARAAPTAVLGDPARWPAAFHRLAAATVEIHAEAVAALGHDAALIGFHGQTVAHRPAEGVTLQLGDGAALARATGAPVVWDFRAADVAAGGQGAPLAPFYHFALARRMGAAAPLAFLNLGGVGNVTWVDPAAPAPEAPGALLAFDTGPANALIDDLIFERAGERFDRDGAAGAAGRVRDDVIASAMGLEHFVKKPPKSLDRNEFSSIVEAVSKLPIEDAAATLTAFSAEAASLAAAHLPRQPARWLVCGGGRRNPTLMRMLAERIAAPVAPIEAAGLDGDMIEAQAFAHLAARARRGLPNSAPGTTGCPAPVVGAQLSAP